MPSLYELTGEYLALEQAAYADALTEAEFDAMLDALEGAIEQKTDGYCAILAGMRADIDALKAEEERICARRKALESRRDHLKQALSDALTAQGRDKIKTPLFTVFHRTTVKVEISSPQDVPEEYIKPRVLREADVDKTAIKARLMETGEVLPFARLVSERGLTIR